MLDEDLLDLLFLRRRPIEEAPPLVEEPQNVGVADMDEDIMADVADWMAEGDGPNVDETGLPNGYHQQQLLQFLRRPPQLELHLWKWIIFMFAFAFSV